MATISRTGIAGGSLISPTHITNIIDALDGTGIGITVVATGSFSGSLIGNATTATSASYATTATSATTATTASYVLQAVSASFAVSSSIAVSSSFATTASYVAKASSFPFTGSAIISGSLRVVGATTVTGSISVNQEIGMHSVTGTIVGHPNLNLNLTDVGKSPSDGQFVIPKFTPAPGGGPPGAGAMYWDDVNSVLYIYQETGGGAWRSVSLT